ncbi:MAG TPA: CHAT domain-containing protein [Pyrinomonadaceae bacterium]|nr:CHAT domain-containing protein [Pyrinomonadaceae bacterium]
MPSRKIAERLISAKTSREREKILSNAVRSGDLEIAHELKNICYEVWTSEPKKAQKTASVLLHLCRINPHREIAALAFWVAGIAELTRGKFEKTVENLDRSAEIFRKIKLPRDAANTQVAKLIALALLGKYREAVKTGKAALKVFEKYGDELAAGKIEKNLGNIISRQNNILSAEKYFLSAMRRFEKVKNIDELAMCETNLADNYADLNDFSQAEKYYALALEHAQKSEMFFVEAETEATIGNLAMFRGKYDQALRYLELARQKFEKLGVAHRTIIADLEIAEIYQTLNLSDEAFNIYETVTGRLRKMKLQGDEARARANFGRVALVRKDFGKARKELKKAAQLYKLEKNPSGLADVKLTEANLELTRRNFPNALIKIREAEKILTRSENLRQKLFAKWLHGEILQNLGRLKNAEKILLETYGESIEQEQLNLAQICLNSLGNLALRKNETGEAEGYFNRAVRMIETIRAPLAAEEFRMAFLADKLAPFENLAKIHLAENDPEKAFSFIEKARARTLSESLSGNFSQMNDKASSELSKKLEDLREQLNWFYSRLNRADAERGELETLQKEAKRREKQIADVMRQIESTRTNDVKDSAKHGILNERDELRSLQKNLGKQKALIEFVCFDDSLSAFVVTSERIDFVPHLSKENKILTLLEGLQFQFGALRYGAKNLGNFIVELKKRADSYLQKLYQELVRPLENFIGGRDLVIVPVGATHYVPFHALHSGEKYLVETREIVYSPSAAVWQFLTNKPARKTQNALLIGFADEKIPLVDREIEALQKIFPAAKTFTGESANFSNYRQNAQKFDILHLACHGQFRPENPLFSSLHLADGFVTVRDICAQNLNAALVTLSACETGLNKIYAGDEILGLARGFLAAGADSLVLSLWTVSDEATVRLMKDFYTFLQRGETVAASLRLAQINFIQNNSHPYFWSPFTVIGK